MTDGHSPQPADDVVVLGISGSPRVGGATSRLAPATFPAALAAIGEDEPAPPPGGAVG